MSVSYETSTSSIPLVVKNTTVAVEELKERVMSWSFTPLVGACVTDERYKNMTIRAFDNLAYSVFNYDGLKYSSMLTTYASTLERLPHKFTHDGKLISSPTFIMADKPAHALNSFVESLTTPSSKFIYNLDNLRPLVVVPTGKGSRISIPLLLKLNIVLQQFVLDNVDKLIVDRVRRSHDFAVHKSSFKSFNTQSIDTSNKILKEELLRRKLTGLCSYNHHRLYRMVRDTDVKGARLNKKAEEIKALCQLEKVVFNTPTALALMVSLNFGSESNCDIEKTMIDSRCVNALGTVYSKPESRLKHPIDMAEAYAMHEKNHLENNDHHPAYFDKLNQNINIKQTIEIMCDLLSCALHQGCMNVNEAAYTISKWLLDENHEITYKYRKLNAIGIIIFCMRAEYLFSGSSTFAGVHRTRDWRSKFYWTHEQFLLNYNSPYNNGWKNGPLGAYYRETRTHTHLVNTLLKCFGIRAKHDCDKFEYYCMIAYTSKWGTTLPSVPTETSDTSPSIVTLSEEDDDVYEDPNSELYENPHVGGVLGYAINPLLARASKSTKVVADEINAMSGVHDTYGKAIVKEAKLARANMEAIRDMVAESQGKLVPGVEEALIDLAKLSAQISQFLDNGNNTIAQVVHSTPVVTKSAERIADSVVNIEKRVCSALDHITKPSFIQDATQATGLSAGLDILGAFNAFIAPVRAFVSQIASMIRSSFNNIRDLFTKLGLPERNGDVLGGFTDSEIIEIVVIVILFYRTEDKFFRTILAFRMCLILDIGEALRKAYNSAKRMVTKLFKKGPVEETSGEEAPPSFYEVIINMLTEPTPITYAALLTTVAVAYFGVKAATSGTKSFASITIQGLRNIGFATMGVAALPKLVECFAKGLEFIKKSYLSAKTGEKGKTVSEMNLAAMELLTVCNTLDSDEIKFAASRDDQTRLYVKAKLEELSQMIKDYAGSDTYSPHYFRQLMDTERRLIPFKNSLQDLGGDKAFRVVPYSVQFTGRSQIGKSEVMKRLALHVEKTLWGQQTANSEIYTRNNADQYISRYNGEKIFLRDDVFAVVSDEEVAEWIAMKSSAPVYLNMAELKEKGKPFKAEVIITSTNTPFPQQNTVRHPEAVMERRDLLWEVLLAPGWVVPITERQYLEKGLTANDMQNFHHCVYALRHRMHQNEYLKVDMETMTATSSGGHRTTVGFEDMLKFTMHNLLVYNIEKNAQVISQRANIDYSDAMLVESLYREISIKNPQLRMRTFIAGVPSFTRDEFREKYLDSIIENKDLPRVDLRKLVEDSMKESYSGIGDDEDEEEEEEDSPTETGFFKDTVTRLARDAVSLQMYRTSFKYILGKEFPVSWAGWWKVQGWCIYMNAISRVYNDNLKFRSTYSTLQNQKTLIKYLKDKYRMEVVGENETAQLVACLTTLSEEEMKNFLEEFNIAVCKHPVPHLKKRDAYSTIDLIPYNDRIDSALANIINIALCSRRGFGTKESEQMLLANAFYFNNKSLYRTLKFNKAKGEIVTGLTFQTRFRSFLNEFVDMRTLEQCATASPAKWPIINGETGLYIEVARYPHLPEDIVRMKTRDSICLDEVIPDTIMKGHRLDSATLMCLRPEDVDGRLTYTIDFVDLARYYLPDYDFADFEKTPRQKFALFRTKCDETIMKRIKQTIWVLANLEPEQMSTLFDYVLEGLEDRMEIQHKINVTIDENIDFANKNEIPNTANRVRLFLSSKIVNGVLLAGMAYGCYIGIKSVIRSIFPSTSETSKLMLRTGKAKFLTAPTQTNSVEETSVEENAQHIAAAMIDRAVRVVLHRDDGDVKFNGFCFGQNLLTIAHSFLHQDYHKRKHLDISVMIGDDPEAMQRFTIPTTNMVFDNNSDRVLMRIPEMRFFRKFKRECFLKIDDFMRDNFNTDTLYGYAFFKDHCQPFCVSGARFVNRVKIVNSTTDLSLPNYLIFSGAMDLGTSGTLFYTIRPDNTVKVLGIQSCREGGQSYLAPITREWIDASLNTLDQRVTPIEHEGPILCCDEQPHSRITLKTGIPFVGSVPKGGTMHSITRSQLHKTIISEAYATGEIPAILNPRDPLIPDGSHPLQHSLNKWSATEMVQPPPHLIERAINDVTLFYKGELGNPKFTTNYTLEEVIVGHHSPLALNTSPGLPYTLDRYQGKPAGKRAYININELGEVDYIADELREDYEAAGKSMARGVIPPNSNYVFPKDELRPRAKAIGPPVKTRSISVMNQVFSLLFRKHMMDYETALATLANGSQPYCVGMSPESATGNSMYEHMTRVGRKGFDFDVSHWDGHYPAWLFLAVLEHIRLMYGWEKSSGEYLTMRCLFLNALFGFEQYEDIVYQKPAGMPSGFAGTAPINTLGHIILFYILYLYICEKQDKAHYANWACFRAFLCFYMYGDDVTATISDFVVEWLNAQSFAEAYSTFGWPVTTASKGGSIELYKDVADLQFLKRSWVPSDTIPGYHQMALDKRTIDRLCEWYRVGDDNEKQQRENFYTHLEYSYYHGKATYEANLNKLNACLLELKARPFMISFSQMEAIIRSRVSDIYAPIKKNTLVHGVEETSDIQPLDQVLGEAVDDFAEIHDTHRLIDEEAQHQQREDRGAIRRLERVSNSLMRTANDLVRGRGTDWFMVFAIIALALATLLHLRRRR